MLISVHSRQILGVAACLLASACSGTTNWHSSKPAPIVLKAVSSFIAANGPAGVRFTVVDSAGNPVAEAAVPVDSTRLGQLSDKAGLVDIAPIPPGTYGLRVSKVGYRDVLITDVKVIEGHTTLLEPVRLTSTPVQLVF